MDVVELVGSGRRRWYGHRRYLSCLFAIYLQRHAQRGPRAHEVVRKIIKSLFSSWPLGYQELAVHALSHCPCGSELVALGIQSTSTSHADLGHNLPNAHQITLSGF